MFSGGGDAGEKCKMQISFIVVMHLAIQALSLASLQACHRETKEANIPNKRNIVKSPNWQGSDLFCCLQSVTEDLNSGLPRNKSHWWQGVGRINKYKAITPGPY